MAPTVPTHFLPPPIPRPPGLGDFVIPDTPPQETMRHRTNITLLYRAFRAHVAGQDVYVGAEQWVYFNIDQIRGTDFRAPDVYVVRGVEDRERRAWIVWEEGGVMPHLAVELLSDSTRDVDFGVKKRIYEQVLRTPEYFLFDPFRDEPPRHFRLEESGYVEVLPDARGRFPTRVLGGYIGVWEGEYEGVHARWLRLFDAAGEVVWLPEELTEESVARAEQESARAEQESARAEQASARAEQESARADEAAARAEAFEAELAAYRARFGALED